LALYRQALRPANAAALLLKHTAFRDVVQGRELLGAQHYELADLIYQGHVDERLYASPLWPVLREVLGIAQARAVG
jgi:hypothetical protein